MLMAMCSKLGMVSLRVELRQIHETIFRQHSLHPESADVVLARCDQHVGHGAPEGRNMSVISLQCIMLQC